MRTTVEYMPLYILRGEDIAFYVNERQVEGGKRPEMDTVEERYRGSKDDQGWKGAALVRMEGDGDKGSQAVELLLNCIRYIKGG